MTKQIFHADEQKQRNWCKKTKIRAQSNQNTGRINAQNPYLKSSWRHMVKTQNLEDLELKNKEEGQ